MTDALNYTRASGGAFQGWLHSANPDMPFVVALKDGLYELSDTLRAPALDGGSKVWAHHWEWAEQAWKRGGQVK